MRKMENGSSQINPTHEPSCTELHQRLMVFEGKPSVYGEAHGPFSMESGMNRFLKNLGITFRRDEETRRPRVNNLGSRLDREQKESGNYYYSVDS